MPIDCCDFATTLLAMVFFFVLNLLLCSSVLRRHHMSVVKVPQEPPRPILMRALACSYTSIAFCDPLIPLHLLAEIRSRSVPRRAIEFLGELQNLYISGPLFASRRCKRHDKQAMPIFIELRFLLEMLGVWLLLFTRTTSPFWLCLVLVLSLIKISYLLRTIFYHGSIQDVVGVWNHARQCALSIMSIIFYTLVFALLYMSINIANRQPIDWFNAVYDSAAVGFTFDKPTSIGDLVVTECVMIVQAFIHLFLVGIFVVHVFGLLAKHEFNKQTSRYCSECWIEANQVPTTGRRGHR